MCIRDSITTKVTIEGPGQISLDYLLTDPSRGTIISSGKYPYQDKDTFEITIPKDVSLDLDESTYHLFLLAASDELARVVERKIDIDLFSDGDKESSTKDADLQATQNMNNDGNEDSRTGTSLNQILGIILVTAGVIGIALIILILRSRSKNI